MRSRVDIPQPDPSGTETEQLGAFLRLSIESLHNPAVFGLDVAEHPASTLEVEFTWSDQKYWLVIGRGVIPSDERERLRGGEKWTPEGKL
jgi:hypothetical protein